MAVGNVVSNITSVTNASSMFIQPSSGQEWVIHNIYHTKDIGLVWTTSNAAGPFVSTVNVFSGNNVEMRLQFHVTNSIFLALACLSAQIVGYDGVRTA